MKYQQLHTSARLTVSLVSVAILISCGGDISVTPPTIISITVTPAAQRVAMGKTLQYTIDATLSNGAVDTNLSPSSLVWKTSSAASATISSTGLLSGIAAGSTTVTATIGIVTSSTTVTVTGPAVSAGANHTLAIKADGTLWAWGSNSNGQLGNEDGANAAKRVPTPIGAATNWTSISAGNDHSLAIRADGTLWAWGANASGQLGDSTSIDNKNAPIQIGRVTVWASVSAGDKYSLAIQDDGTLWAWGKNDFGQLGNGGIVAKTPIKVGEGTNWASVSAGGSHTLAIKADGTLWAWGANTYGQLGDRTNTHRNEPILIDASINWASVSAGTLHSLAIKANGTLWAWGQGTDDRLGNGGVATNTPTQVGIDTNWTSVSAGDKHGFARKADGTFWAWGLNSFGQLGDESFTTRSVPIRTTKANNWAFVSAGDNHTLAIKADGTFWAWGLNTDGQLGFGTVDPNKSSPVNILF